MRIAFCFVVFFYLTSLSAVAQKAGKYLPGDFKLLKYDSVVVYQYKAGPFQNFVEKGKIQNNMLVSSVKLLKKQCDSIQAILFNTSTYGTLPDHPAGKGELICYYIAYYINDHRVAFIDVSTHERSVSSNYEIEAAHFSKIKDKQSPYYVYAQGFSKEGEKRLFFALEQVFK